MPYALSNIGQGSTAYGALTAWTRPTTGDWWVRIKFSVNSVATTQHLLGRSSSAAGSLRVVSGGILRLRDNNADLISSASGSIVADTIYDAKFGRSGSNFFLELDSSPVGTATYAASTITAPMNQVMRFSSSGYGVGVIYELETSGGTYNALLNGSNAPSTGTTWTDGVATITATNFTGAADSWWLLYGSATTASATLDLGSFGFAISANDTASAFSASAAYDLGDFGFVVTASSVAPTFTATASYDIGSFGFSATANSFAPGNYASVSLDVGAFGFDVSASSSAPVLQSSTAYDLGVFGFAVNAGVLNNDRQATTIFDIGAFGFSAVAASTIPPVSASASYDIGAFTFSISAGFPSETVEAGATITFTEKSRTISFIEQPRSIGFTELSRTIKF